MMVKNKIIIYIRIFVGEKKKRCAQVQPRFFNLIIEKKIIILIIRLFFYEILRINMAAHH
jgi:hypothetical protein